MYSPTEITTHLRTIVAKSLQIPEITVKLESTLLDQLGAESIDILDIKFAIEQQFGFKFDNDEIRAILVQAATAHNLTEKDIPSLFRVQHLYDYIILKVEPKHASL